MVILYIGDTFGSAGRAIVKHYLKNLQEHYRVDLTILNCENAAAGFGITPKIADEFFDWGIDVLTSGTTSRTRKRFFRTSTRIRAFYGRQIIRPEIPAPVVRSSRRAKGRKRLY